MMLGLVAGTLPHQSVNNGASGRSASMQIQCFTLGNSERNAAMVSANADW